MTILRCKKNCITRSYKYAGVEFSKECFCGNDRPKIPAPETDCSMACAGDKSEKCGGGNRINVYEVVPGDDKPELVPASGKGGYLCIV